MQLSDEQLAIWRRDGSLVVPDVFPPEAYEPALEAIERNAYGGLTYTEYQAKWDENPAEIREAYEKTPSMLQRALWIYSSFLARTEVQSTRTRR